MVCHLLVSRSRAGMRSTDKTTAHRVIIWRSSDNLDCRCVSTRSGIVKRCNLVDFVFPETKFQAHMPRRSKVEIKIAKEALPA